LPEPQSTAFFVLLLVIFGALICWLVLAKHLVFRILAACLAFIPAVVFGIAAVNKYYDYYQNWASAIADFSNQGGQVGLLSDSPASAAGVAVVLRSTVYTKLARQGGFTLRLRVHGQASHLTRDVYIYLPPQYFQPRYRHHRFGVIELIHGFPGQPQDWITVLGVTATLRSLVSGGLAKPVVLVMPDGGHESWYIDSPYDRSSRYETYVGGEVVSYIDMHFRTIATREARAITGLSMCGFGALRIALDRQETFGAAGSISGAVDPRNCEDEPGIDHVFGDPMRHASFWHSNAVVDSAQDFEHAHIALTIDCGVSDFFVQSNRTLHEKLVALGVPHDYAERPGGHTWSYWSNSIRYQVLFFATAFQRAGWHPQVV